MFDLLEYSINVNILREFRTGIDGDGVKHLDQDFFFFFLYYHSIIHRTSNFSLHSLSHIYIYKNILFTLMWFMIMLIFRNLTNTIFQHIKLYFDKINIFIFKFLIIKKILHIDRDSLYNVGSKRKNKLFYPI